MPVTKVQEVGLVATHCHAGERSRVSQEARRESRYEWQGEYGEESPRKKALQAQTCWEGSVLDKAKGEQGASPGAEE